MLGICSHLKNNRLGGHSLWYQRPIKKKQQHRATGAAIDYGQIITTYVCEYVVMRGWMHVQKQHKCQNDYFFDKLPSVL